MSEFSFESYVVQFCLVASKSVSMGGACSTEGRRGEPRKKHHYGKLYQSLVFTWLSPTSLHTDLTVIIEHITLSWKDSIFGECFQGRYPYSSLSMFLPYLLREPCSNSKVKNWSPGTVFIQKANQQRQEIKYLFYSNHFNVCYTEFRSHSYNIQGTF